ncbi:F0F1 ATP synthase subunit alpha [Candidatus Roizmanbacteria bacterium RIFCSPLOWO2_02_FULL_37_19]|uniref:ATP synthase subunit alpha n=1 Tax=Candidatus Roizmanbacteria bacterium RIFCSPHIGHO2_02_FULL_37_24 TaxID=1802037 RepID=A0A1F7GYX6_9BACT|nr:MAG: F0F1 ATP synthase subunit alpha [Candidatus Roizmanbacteria bacterium RIFCSPHIGHO2_01_FULL_38_41]OGK23746.1 MAG: F0F1 ATP synthase subunit alpha [Candidatus Roizmanbacteria bacterium RIFCSPHIGHO2_02_FULL_37_24]OGK32681.1 MAG: F0F1 ATP synthase subunit alpha [Candidatus Roizmanbacteria bacterium RIFCSPHIGHO2_12_FULL_37_23]OGK44753.1 MAG: F0F1 ATP synthase subunit alpha [Candidatus Roizmanbacteria bacterium RIFCSPLOWO2_01_FULL_37_57]OGK53995.1 MAG: F0F1 ATP synthase subunit alpha [Candida
MKVVDEIIREVEKEIKSAQPRTTKKNIGYVVEVKDEIVFIDGLYDSPYGEMVEFGSGNRGMIVDLFEDRVGVIVFGDFEKIKEGDIVKGTGDVFKIPISEDYIGRIVNGIGEPIDGKGKIKAKQQAFIDPIAPGVIERQSVNQPVQTGIKAIDALIPIGRGQRELIIGDRRTGKTTVAVDTILNQKDQNMICIYCAIGQRLSSTAILSDLLQREGAMKYSIIVAASASDPASMQYVAPYVATTIGEYFMSKGKDVLIVYDDLSKHAWAYRQVSLILRRPSGREAYPGDIFYLHSRLLERSCRLNDKIGGGSITSLPIVETQEGDVSAYIPTNIISITDGQIYLESDLFNAGIRPAINVGLSVSRVGSTAQAKAMKTVAGKLKNDLAQYRALAAFAQFESELDEETKKFIDRGARMTQLLIQSKNQPYDLARQVVVFWAGGKGYLDSIPTDKIKEFESKFIEFMELSHKKILEAISTQKSIDEKIEKQLKKVTEEFMNLHYSNVEKK